MRKFLIAAAMLGGLSACVGTPLGDAYVEGNERARAWACAPTTTLAQRRAALANANALREQLLLPPRVAFDCDKDGKPDL